MEIPITALLVPIVGIISGTVMIIAVVGLFFWFKARMKELEFNQDLRLREMEHQRRMKELEIELERTKARGSCGQAA